MSKLSSPDNSKKASLHSRSKRINKTKPLAQADEDFQSSLLDAADKKYKTYTKSQKFNIVSDIRKAIVTHINSSPDHLINHLDNMDKAQYNQLIESILLSHAPSALKYKGDKKQWQKELKQWRKQLKSWIRNIDKPETRGGVRVVPHEKTTEFKQKIIDILHALPNRSFDLLREKALDALKEMYDSQGEDEGQNVINESTFSKHFWYDYMKANPDIEELYSALPICRNVTRRNVSKTKANSFDKAMLLFDGEGQFEGCSNGIEEFNKDTGFLTDKPVDFIEEQKETELNPGLPILEFNSQSENKSSSVDFYKSSKMIVEAEDNETQRTYFKHFCQNGIDI